MDIDPDQMVFSTVVGLEESAFSDMIYVSDQLETGSLVTLNRTGTNVVGDLRYEVKFGKFSLGFVTLTGFLSHFYENSMELYGEILNLEKRRNLPISKLDLRLQSARLRKVS